MELARFLLETLVPVFAIIAVGYGIAGWKRFDVQTLADLAVLITAPALIFSLLSRTQVGPEQMFSLVGGTIWLVGASMALAALYVRYVAREPVSGPLRGIMLTAAFWNAGNMGLPCAQFAFGERGLEAAAVMFVTVIGLQSTLGIWIAKGKGGIREALRMPLFYAAGLGFLVNAFDVELSPTVARPIDMLAGMTIPLMLMNLGIQLRVLKVDDLKHSVAAIVVRNLGGLAAAFAFVHLFNVEGLERNILLLAAVLPPAVINVMFAQRYQASPRAVSSAIVLGTMLSVVTLPIMLALLR